jgi:hypothetical protein
MRTEAGDTRQILVVGPMGLLPPGGIAFTHGWVMPVLRDD